MTRYAALLAMVAGAATAITGSLMAWVQTGSRSRNSYDVFDIVERLGFAPDGIEAHALRWWPTMPLVVIAAVVAAWWGFRRSGAVVGIIGGIFAGGIGTTVAAASAARDIEPRGGAVVTAVGGWLLVAASILELAVGRRSSCASAASGLT